MLSPQLHRAPWGSCSPPRHHLGAPSLPPWVQPEQLPLCGALSPFPGHYVIIRLYRDGHIIDTKETKSSSGYSPVWNAPFLFSVPAGDIQQHELALEFVVMQVR